MKNAIRQDNLAAGPSKKDKSPERIVLTKNAKTLVLDDFLAKIEEARSSFKIASTELSLSTLNLSQKTRSAVEKMLTDTIELHSGELYTRVNPLIEPVGGDVCEEEIKTGFAPRYQVSLNRQRDVLRRMLELALLVIAGLPSKDPSHLDSKDLKSLASAAGRLSEKVRAAVRDAHVQARMNSLPGRPNVWKISLDIQEAAEIFDATANQKVRLNRTSSPNPQIRFALYLANWVQTCTGRPHYSQLTALIEGAFVASGKKVPKWVDRLEIEMNRKRKYGARWFKNITS